MVDKFSFAMNNLGHGQSTASSKELLDLLQLCFCGTQASIIVLDGIDECTDANKLIKDLSQADLGSTTKFCS